jgi:predicted KAP-like P-loop ATPase
MKKLIKKLYELKIEINQIDEIIDQLNKSIEKERSSNLDINQAAISNLISSRTNNSEYTKHLGIITSIRKDFETLSELFSDSEAERKNDINTLPNERKALASSFKKGRKLERIILYIDDLDRCPDEKVLEVLQAVHLLMAFPLFIVVVGVDERCVQNALLYNQHKGYIGIDTWKNPFHQIDPSEYLEKIFQIPFQLPVASESSIQNLVEKSNTRCTRKHFRSRNE